MVHFSPCNIASQRDHVMFFDSVLMMPMSHEVRMLTQKNITTFMHVQKEHKENSLWEEAIYDV